MGSGQALPGKYAEREMGHIWKIRKRGKDRGWKRMTGRT